jgi:hypothetical protein
VAPPTGRAGLDGFLSADLTRFGFVLESAQLAPPAYGANPLASGDETQAFLHFSELTAPYMLYVFQKRGGGGGGTPAASPSTAPLASASSSATSSASRPVPPGHTPFSWLPRVAAHSTQQRPPGHSAFSWPVL